MKRHCFASLPIYSTIKNTSSPHCLRSTDRPWSNKSNSNQSKPAICHLSLSSRWTWNWTESRWAINAICTSTMGNHWFFMEFQSSTSSAPMSISTRCPNRSRLGKTNDCRWFCDWLTVGQEKIGRNGWQSTGNIPLAFSLKSFYIINKKHLYHTMNEVESKQSQLDRLVNLTGRQLFFFQRSDNAKLFTISPSNLPLPSIVPQWPGDKIDNPLDQWTGLEIAGLPDRSQTINNLPPLQQLLDRDQYLIVDDQLAHAITAPSLDRNLIHYRLRLLVIDARMRVDGWPDGYYGFLRFANNK